MPQALESSQNSAGDSRGAVAGGLVMASDMRRDTKRYAAKGTATPLSMPKLPTLLRDRSRSDSMQRSAFWFGVYRSLT